MSFWLANPAHGTTLTNSAPAVCACSFTPSHSATADRGRSSPFCNDIMSTTLCHSVRFQLLLCRPDTPLASHNHPAFRPSTPTHSTQPPPSLPPSATFLCTQRPRVLPEQGVARQAGRAVRVHPVRLLLHVLPLLLVEQRQVPGPGCAAGGVQVCDRRGNGGVGGQWRSG